MSAARTVRIGVATAVMLFVLLAFCGLAPSPPQMGPVFLRAAATGAAGAIVWALAWLLLALACGRLYCAALCPLGILQDVIGFAALRRRRAAPKNLKALRYVILAVTAGTFAAGWVGPAKLLEPFTLFGRIFSGFALPAYTWIVRGAGLPRFSGGFVTHTAGMAAGAATFLILVALVLWKRRVFCTAICPVGTLLGLCARVAHYRLRLDIGSCVHCGKCAAVCPAGCIDIKQATLDNERCLRCMSCIAVCPRDVIVWDRRGVAADRVSAGGGNDVRDRSRRTFLVGMASSAVASYGVTRLLKPGTGVLRAPAPAILPPGAGSATRFASTCTTCLLCVHHCPGKVIVPPTVRHATVHLDYGRGMCEFNCNACSHVCPTGAIRPLSLEAKKRCRIGMAVFHASRCIAVVQGIHCGACAEHCPTGALRMVQRDGAPCPVPELNEALCIGCGNCSYPCPVKPIPAMTIVPVPIQTEADDPAVVLPTSAPLPPPDDGDWLI